MRKSHTKTLCILLVVLLVIGGGTFALSRYEEKKEEIAASDEIILTIPSDSVTALSWSYDDTSLSFHRDSDWEWDDDAEFPVDDDAMETLLEPFTSFGASFTIANVTDYSQYGLDDPTAEIHITTDEKTYDISLGSFSTMDEERYVSIGDGNVYLVSHDPMDEYECTISDLIHNDSVPSLSDAQTILFSGNVNYAAAKSEDSDLSVDPDDVWFTEDRPMDTSSVSSYLSILHNLSLTNYVNYKVTDEELTDYGLDDPDLSVTVSYTDADTDMTGNVTVNVGRNQEELQEALDQADEDNVADLSSVSCYVRIGDSKIIYKITESTYEKLTAASYNDLRHKEIVTAPFDTVSKIDITLDGNTYTFTSETNEDEETVWHYGDTEDFSIDDIKTAIYSLKASSFTDDAEKGKEEIRFTLYLDNETFPELNVVLYRDDGTSCLAEVNDEIIGYVSREQVVDLIEAVNSVVLD